MLIIFNMVTLYLVLVYCMGSNKGESNWAYEKGSWWHYYIKEKIVTWLVRRKNAGIFFWTFSVCFLEITGEKI